MRVPVLSKATVRMSRARSKASRLRTRIPWRAASAVAFTITRGIASPNACGHAMTSTVTARSTAKADGARPTSHSPKVALPAATAV